MEVYYYCTLFLKNGEILKPIGVLPLTTVAPEFQPLALAIGCTFTWKSMLKTWNTQCQMELAGFCTLIYFLHINRSD